MALSPDTRELLNKAIGLHKHRLGDLINDAIVEGVKNAAADSEEALKTQTQLAYGYRDHNANQLRIQNAIDVLEDFHKANGLMTTVGGAAVEDFLIPGLLATDKPFVQMHTLGSSPVSILAAKCLDGKIRVTFSANPGNDHQFSFNVGA